MKTTSVKKHIRKGKNKVSVVKKHTKKVKKNTKVKKVMDEWKNKSLHSGSKHGPTVSNYKQAVAIALSEQKKLASKKKK